MSSLLLFGASGQVGGPFLTLFRQKYPEIPVTVFLRSAAYDPALQALGVAIVRGTYADYADVERLASQHSIIINVGSSQDPALTKAILQGARLAPTEKKKILIHMSGAGNFVDGGKSGNYVPQEHPFNDGNEDDVRKIGPENLNGACDELVLKAAVSGAVNGFIVCPGGIYGVGTQNAVTRGTAQLSLGVWATWMVDNIARLGFSPYIGEGTAVFPTIHVDDVVELMFFVFEKALNTWDTYKPEHAYKQFYVGVDERLAAKTIATGFAEYMSETGKLGLVKTKEVPFKEAGSVARYLGGNILVENENAKGLGWRPKAPGMLETLTTMAKSR